MKRELIRYGAVALIVLGTILLISALMPEKESNILTVEIYTFSTAVTYGEPLDAVYIVRWMTLDGGIHTADFSSEYSERAFTLYEYLVRRAKVDLSGGGND